MAFIEVDKSKFREYQDDVQQIKNNVLRIGDDLSRVSTRLDWDVRSKSGIERKIKNLSDDLDREAMVLNKMHDFLGVSYLEYEKLDSLHLEQLNNQVGGSAVSDENQSIISDILTWFGSGVKGIGKFIPFAGNISSILGSTMVGIGDWLSGGYFDYSGKDRGLFGNVVSITKDVRSSIKDYLDVRDIISTRRMNRLLGRATEATQIPISSCKERVLAAVRKQGDEFVDGFKTLDFMKSGFFDVGLSALDNGFDNFAEEGNSFERALGETAVETAIDIAVDVGVKAAVAAGATALGVAGAPVVIVTVAVGAGVGYILDKTGAKEAISDFIMDTSEFLDEKFDEGLDFLGEKAVEAAEFVGDTVADVADFVGDKVTEAADFIGDTIADTGEFIGDTISDVGDFVGDTMKGLVNCIKNPIRFPKVKWGW